MRSLLLLLLASLILGCSQAPKPCDGPTQDDETAQAWHDANAHAKGGSK
jgi:hypothetical protein